MFTSQIPALPEKDCCSIKNNSLLQFTFYFVLFFLTANITSTIANAPINIQ